MDLGLSGRRALVVGGSGFIGRRVAARLRAEGADVVLAARDPGRLAAAAGDLDCRFVVLDLRDEDSVTRGVAEAAAVLGGIDILVNTGAPSARTITTAGPNDPATVLAAVETKAVGYLRCCVAVMPAMTAQGWGRIVNISGANAYLSASLMGAVRNVAVAALSKSLADQLFGTGVTVNVLHPGIVDEHPVTEDPAEFAALRQGRTSVDEVAAMVAFLASTHASTVSGTAIALGHQSPGVIRY